MLVKARYPGRRFTMRAALKILLAVLTGAAIGVAAATSVDYAAHLRYGGSADPRCVLGWYGYVENHFVAHDVDRVSCDYRPEIDGRFPKKT